MTEKPLSLALDQNFPTPLVAAVEEFLPRGITLHHLTHIDTRLSTLTDRQLFIALRQLGYKGLVTNNHKMLNQPDELAAMIATKAVVVAVQALGHDPIRAVGALLMELPGLEQRLRPERANVFRLDYARRRPDDAWVYLTRVAERLGRDARELWREHGVSATELSRTVLD